MAQYPCQIGETRLGPIMQTGTFTLSLELQRMASVRLTRAHAYKIASDLCCKYVASHDVRVVERGQNIDVTVEVSYPEELLGVTETLKQALGGAA